MNKLFPIYVKLEETNTLLVGAGPVGLEKIQAMVSNSPEACVQVIAREATSEFREFISERKNINLEIRDFQDSDIKGYHLIVVASNNPDLNDRIREICRDRDVLLNIADKPALCDFYLGSVVQRGDLKIGISTNGKSPTMAKRLKEIFNELLPEEIDETLDLMARFRGQLQGDLKEKIQVLNKHTKTLIHQKNEYD